MARLGLTCVVTFTLLISVMPFPRETSIDDQALASATTTSSAAVAVTAAPRLACSDGSTILHTTECTLGTPVSFCYKPQPPIKCQSGFFPSIWHPDHCMEESTCFPLNAVWITTECSNGARPYTTKTLFDGTLAGGESTVISSVSCSCASDQWYSMTIPYGSSGVETFCMPYTSCPLGMTTSTGTNEYCATATEAACADIPTTTVYCKCQNPMQTPVYGDEPEEPVIGCEY